VARLHIPDDLGTRPVPRATTTALDALAAGLDHDVPAKRGGQTLIIGTWNVALFGGVHDDWVTGPQDHPKRKLTDL
jgi:hypothetical protein